MRKFVALAVVALGVLATPTWSLSDAFAQSTTTSTSTTTTTTTTTTTIVSTTTLPPSVTLSAVGDTELGNTPQLPGK